MIELFDLVKIKETGLICTVVHEYEVDGTTYYTVESNTKGALKGGDGNVWPLYECTEGELQRL